MHEQAIVDRLKTANGLIAQGEYDAARVILDDIDDNRAQQLLDYLNSIDRPTTDELIAETPPQKQKAKRGEPQKNGSLQQEIAQTIHQIEHEKQERTKREFVQVISIFLFVSAIGLVLFALSYTFHLRYVWADDQYMTYCEIFLNDTFSHTQTERCERRLKYYNDNAPGYVAWCNEHQFFSRDYLLGPWSCVEDDDNQLEWGVTNPPNYG